MATKRRRAESDTGEAEREQMKRASPIDQRREALRSQWEFAALHQFLYLFGKSLKVPNCNTIEQLEDEIIDPSKGETLAKIQLGLLGNVSSQRGLTIDQFEDYTRRQYRSREYPTNPFGDDEEPIKFRDLEPHVKVQVLHQLSQWIVFNTERFREKLVGNSKEPVDQTNWRMEPIGWDAKGNTYFIFDDMRLYYRSEPQFITYPKKAKSRSKASRRSKGGRRSSGINGNAEDDAKDEQPNDPLQHMEWKCVCATIEEYRQFIDKLVKSRNPDEKSLHSAIIEDIMPIMEKEEAAKQRKALEREKEEARQLLLAGRKRSSRIDERMARQKEVAEREAKEREEREIEEAARKEELKRRKEEETQRAKLMEREQRLQLRDQRAKLRHQEIERLKEEAEDSAESSGSTRKSFRSRNKREAELQAAAEEDEWVFDCVCGVHGINFDDGTKSICCDRCSIWQHTACLKLSDGEEDAEFICERCRLKEAGLLPQTSPRVVLRLRMPERKLQQPMSQPTSDSEDESEGENGDRTDVDDDATISERSRSTSPLAERGSTSDEKIASLSSSKEHSKRSDLSASGNRTERLEEDKDKDKKVKLERDIANPTFSAIAPAPASASPLLPPQTSAPKAQSAPNGNLVPGSGVSNHGKLQFQGRASPVPPATQQQQQQQQQQVQSGAKALSKDPLKNPADSQPFQQSTQEPAVTAGASGQEHNLSGPTLNLNNHAMKTEDSGKQASPALPLSRSDEEQTSTSDERKNAQVVSQREPQDVEMQDPVDGSDKNDSNNNNHLLAASAGTEK